MGWADLITALSVLIAALTFMSGVFAWKREFVGKRRIELAESVLAMFYEAQDAIAAIRHPFASGTEGTSRKRAENECEEESSVLDQAYVAVERYQKRESLFAQLQSMRYRCMATFGPDAAEPFNEITRVVNEIHLAAGALGRTYWQDQGRRQMTEQQFAIHLQSMSEYEAVFWSRGQDDPIANRVREAIQGMEAVTRREVDAVRRRPFLDRWRSWL